MLVDKNKVHDKTSEEVAKTSMVDESKSNDSGGKKRKLPKN